MSAYACSDALRNAGLPYPRTCAQCGLGPCLVTPPKSLHQYHVAPVSAPGVDEAQLLADFRKLDTYGCRCALAMLAGLARLGATS